MSFPTGDGIEYLRDMDASRRWHDEENETKLEPWERLPVAPAALNFHRRM